MQTIQRKTILNKSKVEYADYAINHALGCGHGCKYPCYAFQRAKRYGWVKSYKEWTEPQLVENALELLVKEIPKKKDKIEFVHLSFMTDPFMKGYKEVSDMSLKIIGMLNEYDIRCTVLTKGLLPNQLTDIKKYGSYNEYGISLVSIDEKFRQRYEPGTADYSSRIGALKHLHKQGLKTWVSIEPYPTPAIFKQDLEQLLDKIQFVDKIVFGKLNGNTPSTRWEKKNPEFYETCAQVIWDFSLKKKIDIHIKFGTRKFTDKKTQDIFWVLDM